MSSQDKEPTPSQIRPLRLTPQQVAMLQQRGSLSWIPDVVMSKSSTSPVAPRTAKRNVPPKRIQRNKPVANDLFPSLDIPLTLTNTSTVRKKGKSLTAVLMDAGDWF